MQAIILAAGEGRRLLPLTRDLPKSLIAVNGKTILERITDSFLEESIVDITVVIGHHGQKIKFFFGERYPSLKIRYVKNDRFSSTNSIYSLWMSRESVIEDVILVHGDLLYEKSLLRKIAEHASSCVLIGRSPTDNKKDFKAEFKNGYVSKIAVSIDGEKALLCMPLFKFLRKDWEKFSAVLDDCIARGRTSLYAEDALNEVLNDVQLSPLYFDEGSAMEIDDHDDLKLAERLFS